MRNSRDGGQRVEHAVAPYVTGPVAGVKDVLVLNELRPGLDTAQRGSDGVGSDRPGHEQTSCLVSLCNQHHDRRFCFAQALLKRVGKRTYDLATWHSCQDEFLEALRPRK